MNNIIGERVATEDWVWRALRQPGVLPNLGVLSRVTLVRICTDLFYPRFNARQVESIVDSTTTQYDRDRYCSPGTAVAFIVVRASGTSSTRLCALSSHYLLRE